MKFHICNIERQGCTFGHFLDDSCRLFSYALESLGHSCSMGCNQLEPDRLNIIFCGHTLNTPEEVATVAGACRYIAIQHEILNPDGVNLSQDSAHFQNVYLPFLQRSLAVWEGTMSNLPFLEKLGVRAISFRGGYHPAMEDIRPANECDVDFLFFGSVTPYRRKMLELLHQRGHQVVAIFDARAAYRNNLIARAKVQLAPIQGPTMRHFAYGRVCYLLNNRSLVVVQRCQDQSWLEPCFITSSEQDWADVCEQTLLRPDRNALRDEFHERFRQFPFTDQIQRLLDVTFSHHNQVDAWAAAKGLPREQTIEAIAQTD